MNRETIYILPDDSEESTFCYDEDLPKLPLPKLEDTLERYYESLKPFGTEEELAQSKKIVEDFKNGIGKDLHTLLEEKASKEKNWVEKFWEDYAYGSLRMPLIPFCVMAQPLILESDSLKVMPQRFLRNTAVLCYHNMSYWKLLRKEKIRPMTSIDRKTKFSSQLYKRLYNTVRRPGEEIDKVVTFFKTEKEGDCPSHIIVIYQGRIFKVNCLDNNNEVRQPQEILIALQQIQTKVENQHQTIAGIPLLTNDERTTWAKNREYLSNMSENNRKIIEEIESAVVMISLDTHEPKDYSELCVKTLTGDMHSKWADKSSANVVFKNGQIGCMGEHSCYDGSISVATSLYVLLSSMEDGDPDWADHAKELLHPEELIFDVDDHIRGEINRMEDVAERMQDCVGISCDQFSVYGKEFMKAQKVHPDSYVQTALLLAYFRMHGSYPPTYETAQMRQYYNGRTETTRSCSMDTVRFIEAMENSNETVENKKKLFKLAADRQMWLMNEARKGNGCDRHLFGLWCVAYENRIEIPDLYSDVLYTKSGGGGNFILSTSTLGYTANVGFVAPMCLDGYGVFYSMLNDCVWTIITAYKESQTTSCFKFSTSFQNAMKDIQALFLDKMETKL